MSGRTIIIIIIVLAGLVFLVPSNPYTDTITKPFVKVIKGFSTYFNDDLKIKLPAEETKVYKWQDEKGDWHFSNTAPPKNVESKSKVYNSDENVVPAPKTEK